MADTAEQKTNKKDVVPLSKHELLLGGISNIIIMTSAIIFETWVDSTVTFDHTNITTEQELSDFGEYMTSNIHIADGVQSCAYVLIFPLFIFQYVAMLRVLKICFVKYHILRILFSFSYILFTAFVYMSNTMAILSDAFNWNIYETNENQILLSSANMIQLCIVRIYILFTSFAIYVGSIGQISYWLIFLYALFFDSKYNTSNDLKISLVPSLCGINIVTKILLIFLTFFTLIASYLTIFAWNYTGFWSLSGGSQIFQIFPIVSSFCSGIWLIWFAVSNNYQKFNQRIHFEQFL